MVGAHVDDIPTTPLDHDWGHRAAEQERPACVGAHDLLEVGDPLPPVIYRPGYGTDPGVVDQNVDAPMSRHGAVDHSAYIGGVADIGHISETFHLVNGLVAVARHNEDTLGCQGLASSALAGISFPTGPPAGGEQ